ncbi:HD domain-containing protein [Hominifimenecus sp. rT4P-3]|uniref:CCA tRNA nucleotidyltransferase n=1 Tax=Hominifimenecus sp. rT4P-3 TaxID=3242979 RepID=UPI003DA342BF
MVLSLPEHVSEILRILTKAGHEAYAVGGCVRDTLLGRVPEDWDITTSARPDQVKKLFRRTIDTGIQHGTVTVMFGKDGFEVTTYRIDGEYEDGRHPKEVVFTPNLEEDLKRRDFTINAMAYHPDQGLVDLFGGNADLAEGIIRAVGTPEERFQEDALRILRAIRFAAQLGFTIEKKTLGAISAFAERLKLVSKERIQVELHKLLKSDHPEQFRLLYETGITSILFPRFDEMMALPQHNPYHCYTVGEHTLKMLTYVEPDPLLRWCALLHDTGKTATHSTDSAGIDHFYGHGMASAIFSKDFLRELRFDNDTIDAVFLLTKYHDYSFDLTKHNLRRAIYKVGNDLFPLLLKLVRADTMAKSDYAKERLLPKIDRLEELYAEIIRDNDCTDLKRLAVHGRDLIAAGMKPGPQMGEVLNRLLMLVLEHPEYNTKETLMKYYAVQQREENDR